MLIAKFRPNCTIDAMRLSGKRKRLAEQRNYMDYRWSRERAELASPFDKYLSLRRWKILVRISSRSIR
jgi:hypothetical protein